MKYLNDFTVDRLSRRQLLKMGMYTSVALSLPFSALSASKSGIIDQRAPELEVDYWIDKDGKQTTFSLAQHPDKWIILECFQNWCPGCRSHGLPALRDFSNAFSENPKIAIAGIQTVFEGFHSNTLDKIRKIQLEYDLKIPMGHHPGNPKTHKNPKMMLDYRVGGTPWIILINPERKVIYNGFNINVDKAIDFLTNLSSG